MIMASVLRRTGARVVGVVCSEKKADFASAKARWREEVVSRAQSAVSMMGKIGACSELLLHSVLRFVRRSQEPAKGVAKMPEDMAAVAGAKTQKQREVVLREKATQLKNDQDEDVRKPASIVDSGMRSGVDEDSVRCRDEAACRELVKRPRGTRIVEPSGPFVDVGSTACCQGVHIPQAATPPAAQWRLQAL